MPFPLGQPGDVNPGDYQQGELLSALQRSPELNLRRQFAAAQYPSWAARAFAPGGFGSQAPPQAPPSAGAMGGIVLPGAGGGSVHLLPTSDERGQQKFIGMPSPTPAPANLDYGPLGALGSQGALDLLNQKYAGQRIGAFGDAPRPGVGAAPAPAAAPPSIAQLAQAAGMAGAGAGAGPLGSIGLMGGMPRPGLAGGPSLEQMGQELNQLGPKTPLQQELAGKERMATAENISKEKVAETTAKGHVDANKYAVDAAMEKDINASVDRQVQIMTERGTPPTTQQVKDMRERERAGRQPGSVAAPAAGAAAPGVPMQADLNSLAQQALTASSTLKNGQAANVDLPALVKQMRMREALGTPQGAKAVMDLMTQGAMSRQEALTHLSSLLANRMQGSGMDLNQPQEMGGVKFQQSSGQRPATLRLPFSNAPLGQLPLSFWGRSLSMQGPGWQAEHSFSPLGGAHFGKRILPTTPQEIEGNRADAETIIRLLNHLGSTPIGSAPPK